MAVEGSCRGQHFTAVSTAVKCCPLHLPSTVVSITQNVCHPIHTPKIIYKSDGMARSTFLPAKNLNFSWLG